jgi:hypothetical protein
MPPKTGRGSPVCFLRNRHLEGSDATGKATLFLFAQYWQVCYNQVVQLHISNFICEGLAWIWS